jgi:hypothetical protein
MNPHTRYPSSTSTNPNTHYPSSTPTNPHTHTPSSTPTTTTAFLPLMPFSSAAVTATVFSCAAVMSHLFVADVWMTSVCACVFCVRMCGHVGVFVVYLYVGYVPVCVWMFVYFCSMSYVGVCVCVRVCIPLCSSLFLS